MIAGERELLAVSLAVSGCSRTMLLLFQKTQENAENTVNLILIGLWLPCRGFLFVVVPIDHL